MVQALWHFYHTIAQSHLWAPQWSKKTIQLPRAVHKDWWSPPFPSPAKSVERPRRAKQRCTPLASRTSCWSCLEKCGGRSECDPPDRHMDLHGLKFHGWKIMVFTFKHHLSSSSCDGFKHGFTSFIIFFKKRTIYHDLSVFHLFPARKQYRKHHFFPSTTTWQVDHDHPRLSWR